MVDQYEMECCTEERCEGWMDKCKDGTYVLASDYAKLDAENAELRKCLEFSQGEALELRKHRKPLRDLAAANATLDRLREVVGTDKPLLLCLNCDDWYNDEDPESGECPDCGGDLTTDSRALQSVWNILYPTPDVTPCQ